MTDSTATTTSATTTAAPETTSAGARTAAFVVLFVAVVAVSNGSIFVRLAHAAPLAISAWRITLASLVVVPLALVYSRSRRVSFHAERAAAIAGVLLALHFATWIASLSYTTVAQSVVLLTTAPVWVAVLGRAFGLVRVSGAVWAAIALCVAGSALIAGGDVLAGGSWRGNVLALTAAFAWATYLLFAQTAQREIDFLGFVGRSYGTAAIVLWIAVLATGTQATGFDGQTWLAFAGLAVVSQLVGHGGANWSLRHLPPSFVSLALLGEPILASLLAWWLLGENVGPLLWVGGALIFAGILLSARAMQRAAAVEDVPA